MFNGALGIADDGLQFIDHVTSFMALILQDIRKPCSSSGSYFRRTSVLSEITSPVCWPAILASSVTNVADMQIEEAEMILSGSFIRLLRRTRIASRLKSSPNSILFMRRNMETNGVLFFQRQSRKGQ